jgi:hypothetical protein
MAEQNTATVTVESAPIDYVDDEDDGVQIPSWAHQYEYAGMRDASGYEGVLYNSLDYLLRPFPFNSPTSDRINW